MARRRKQDTILDDLHEVFLVVPAWLCLPVALIAYIAINVAMNAFAGSHPMLKGLAQNVPLFGGIAVLLVLLAGLTAAIKKWARRRLYDGQTSLESIRDLSWSDFERLIGEAYRRQGYEVTENGGGGADGGIDLKLRSRSETVIVQCKRWKVYKVGLSPIRELYGVLIAERADRAIFVTTGVYTGDAKNFAAGKPLELIDGAALSRLIPSIGNQPGSQSLEVITDKVGVIEEAPECPVCRRSMLIRTARRGSNAGSRFWGCPAYSQGCKGIRPVG